LKNLPQTGQEFPLNSLGNRRIIHVYKVICLPKEVILLIQHLNMEVYRVDNLHTKHSLGI
jgi:hypothetical protein